MKSLIESGHDFILIIKGHFTFCPSFSFSNCVPLLREGERERKRERERERERERGNKYEGEFMCKKKRRFY